MNSLYRFLSLILLLCIGQYPVMGTSIQPIGRSIGKLHISIDPRMELLAAIHVLSANKDLSNRNLPYSKDILNYFKSFSSQEAVKQTERLLQEYSFSYDAPVNFMLCLSGLPELEPDIKYSDYLSGRSGGSDNLEQYRKSMIQFAQISDFQTFWNSKIALYNQILDLTIAEIEGKDLVEILESYYNETKGSYNVLITPAFYGGKGAMFPQSDGKDNIYASVSTDYNTKDGVPYLDRNNLLYYVWHEFGHSFVNPLTRKYIDEVNAVGKLFEPIKNVMSKEAYTTWESCVNEHIIRAIQIRLVERNLGVQQARELLNNELTNRYIYIEPLIEILKEFEKQRDEKQITFSDFYPQLINLFDQLLKMEYWKHIDTNFRGPINSTFVPNGVWEEKISVIYPTQDIDTAALKIAQDYVIQVFNRIFASKGAVLLADTVALKTDLSECAIMAYGTIESNLFLKQYASSFPFKIENQTIYVNKEYTDKELKLITCVPNPLNPKKGMSIYTALSNREIQGINNVNHGSEDYILFLNRETVISRGFYNKDGKWAF